MRFITTLNNQKCMEWKLNATQGILVSLLYEANAWAKEVIIEDEVYYFVSRNLVISELPMFFDKPDTVYREFKKLSEKGIIKYKKHGKMDLVRLTEKGKEWNFLKSENNSEKNPSFEENSEKNPSKFGKKSENNSEKNPTNKDTILHKDNNIINNNIYRSKAFIEAFESYRKMRKSIKKPMTENSVKRMMKKLEKIENEETAIKMLNKAEDKCWLDVYEIKENDNGNNYNGRNGKEERRKPNYQDGQW